MKTFVSMNDPIERVSNVNRYMSRRYHFKHINGKLRSSNNCNNLIYEAIDSIKDNDWFTRKNNCICQDSLTFNNKSPKIRFMTHSLKLSSFSKLCKNTDASQTPKKMNKTTVKSKINKRVKKTNSTENVAEENPIKFSFADGIYDEALSQRYFQDALIAWRNGEEPLYEPSEAPLQLLNHISTETVDKRIPLVDKIQFTSSFNYCEQLLLRKHRSCQLVPFEMKEILNILTLNNDEELLEQERLLQSNFELEMKAINDSNMNGLFNDKCGNIIPLAEQWSEAIFEASRDPFNGDGLLTDSYFRITDVISSSTLCSQKYPNCDQIKLGDNQLVNITNLHTYQYPSINGKKNSLKANFENLQPEFGNDVQKIVDTKLMENKKTGKEQATDKSSVRLLSRMSNESEKIVLKKANDNQSLLSQATDRFTDEGIFDIISRSDIG